jgi:hypothetical protein
VLERIQYWGEYLDLWGKGWQGSRENYIVRSSKICTSLNIIWMIKLRKRWVGHARERGGEITRFWWGNLWERNHLEDPHIDGRVI